MDNNNSLHELHIILLEIMDEIDRICREHKINYFLDSGSALGAVRHGGFIPWDDDMDVGMLRDDYDRFIAIAQKELSPQFFLQTMKTDPGYLKFNAKIRKNGTFFPEKRNFGRDLHQGIFIDIYPFDFTSDSKWVAELETRKSRFLFKMWMLRMNRMQGESFGKRIIKKVAVILPKDYIRKLCINQTNKYREKSTETVTCYSYKMNNTHMLHFDKSIFETVMDISFEDRTYLIMNDYDTYLKVMFGDYMKLPPKDKRIWHFEGEINFGTETSN